MTTYTYHVGAGREIEARICRAGKVIYKKSGFETFAEASRWGEGVIAALDVAREILQHEDAEDEADSSWADDFAAALEDQITGEVESSDEGGKVMTKKRKLTREDVERIVCEAREAGKSPDLYGVDLSLVDLSGVDLTGVNLKRAILRGANLNNTDLYGANLIVADLRGASLIDASLTVADMSKADLRGADMLRADLEDANLTGAYMIAANLTRAFLRCAILTNANLSGADLTGAILSGADMTGAKLINVDLTDTNLTRAYSPVIHDQVAVQTLFDEMSKKDMEAEMATYHYTVDNGVGGLFAKIYRDEDEIPNVLIFVQGGFSKYEYAHTWAAGFVAALEAQARGELEVSDDAD